MDWTVRRPRRGPWGRPPGGDVPADRRFSDCVIEAGSGEPAEGVRLATMHAAKGLEWPRVYLTEVGRQPGRPAFHRAFVDERELSEEERIFCVAVTRARDTLWLPTPPSAAAAVSR